MATINTLQDLNQALRDNPEWREELRRTLLSAELLALPDTQASLAAEVREFVAATNRRLGSVEVDIVEIRKDIVEIRAEIAEIQKTIAVIQKDIVDIRKDIVEIRAEIAEIHKTIAEIQKDIIEIRGFMSETNRRLASVDQSIDDIRGDIDEIRGDIRAMHGINRRQHDDLQNFRGQFAENTARRKAPSITMAVGSAIGKRLINKRVLTQADLSAFTQNADASRIPYNHIISFQEADLIIEAYNQQNRDDTCFIVVEASYTCAQDDADRARRHAAILRSFTGKPVYPVVSGVRIHDALKDNVNGGGEDAILWHKIDEEELDV